MKEVLPSYTQQKYPSHIPLVMLKDFCLGALMKMSTSKKSFFILKHHLHLSLKWEQMHSWDGPSVLSVYMLSLCICMCCMVLCLSFKGDSFGEFAFFSLPDSK